MIPTRIGQLSLSGTFTGIYRRGNQCVAVFINPHHTETCILSRHRNFNCPTAKEFVSKIPVNDVNEWSVPSLHALCLTYLNLTTSKIVREFLDYVPQGLIPSSLPKLKSTRKVYPTRFTQVNFFPYADYGTSTVRNFVDPMPRGLCTPVRYPTHAVISLKEGNIWFSKPDKTYQIIASQETVVCEV